MDRFFVPLYRYFREHKTLMYTLLVLSSVVFLFFGLKVEFEEDIASLVPSSGEDESELAFGSLEVKDKITLQFTSDSTDTWELGMLVDEFVDGLTEKDSTSNLISDVLYNISDDLPVMALEYAMSNVPVLVDTSAYAGFDSAIANIGETMASNYETVMEDETGSATQMVATDPFALRNVLLETIGIEDAASGGAGFSLVDGHLFCQDQTVALAFVSPSFRYQDSGSSNKLLHLIEDEIESFTEEHPDVSVYVHGTPVKSVGNSRTIKSDLVLTIGLSLLVILIVICLSFKSGRVLLHMVLPVLYGTIFALAVIYWIKGGMSLMALGIGAIVLGVAISYCLHVVVHQRFVGDIEQMLRDESTPVVLGCLTTIGAFLGLLFTSSDLLRDFGIFASLALVGSTFFSLVFLPHFLKEGDVRRNKGIFDAVQKINSISYDRKPLLLVIVVAVIVMGFVFAPKVQFDSDLRNIGYESPATHKADSLYSAKNLHGNIQRYYASTGATLDEALHNFSALKSVTDSLLEEGQIASASTAVSSLFIPTDVQEQRIAAWKSYWTPEKISSARNALNSAARKYGLDPDMFGAFFSMVEADYAPSSLYDSGILPHGLLSTFIEESGGRFLVFNSVQMAAESKNDVDRIIGAMPHTIVIDPYFYTNDMVKIIHDDFNVALAISSVFVFIVLLLAFLNLWVAIIAFLPMFFSWYIVQGVMALFGLPFNLINIVVSTFIFGIGVDYSIFVMQGLLAKAKGKDAGLLDYHKAAIVFSAFVLLVVTVSLLFARHPAIRSIGVSTIIGMASTILITYTLQPFLFRQLMKASFFRKSLKIND